MWIVSFAYLHVCKNMSVDHKPQWRNKKRPNLEITQTDYQYNICLHKYLFFLWETTLKKSHHLVKQFLPTAPPCMFYMFLFSSTPSLNDCALIRLLQSSMKGSPVRTAIDSCFSIRATIDSGYFSDLRLLKLIGLILQMRIYWIIYSIRIENEHECNRLKKGW